MNGGVCIVDIIVYGHRFRVVCGNALPLTGHVLSMLRLRDTAQFAVTGFMRVRVPVPEQTKTQSNRPHN